MVKNFAEADGIDRQLRISNTKDGGWAKFASVNFNHIKENKAWITYRPQQGGSIELRLDSADGDLLCSVPVEAYIDNSYKTVTADIPEISGMHDIYVVFNGNVNVCDFDRMRFGSEYDPLPDVNAITEKLRAAGKLNGAMVLVNADEKATVDTPDDPPGSLRLKFSNAEYNHGFLSSGDRMGSFDRGDYIGFTQVKMDGVVSATLSYATNDAYEGATMELRIDSPTGPIIGSFVTVGTHPTSFNEYKPVQVEVTPTTGFHDFFITASGGENGIGNLDWILFETGTDTAPVQNSIVTRAEGVEPIGLRTLGDLRVVSNGSLLEPKEPIYLKDNCVMTPLNDTISKLGYGWNEESLTITDNEGQSIMLVEGKDIAYVNGTSAKLTTAPEKHADGEWWIPVDLFKLFGDYVDYVESSGYVRIMDVKQTLLEAHLKKIHGEGRNLAFQQNGKSNGVATDEIRGRKPFYAFDGNPSTYWLSPYGYKEDWLWVDLRQVYSISQVEVNFGAAPVSFNVYVSDETDNPKNWKRVATVSEVKGNTVRLEFPDTYARYVKLGDIKKSSNVGLQVTEMKVFE